MKRIGSRCAAAMLFLAAALLAACSPPQKPAVDDAAEPPELLSPSEEERDGEGELEAPTLLDPPYDFDPCAMSPSDFGAFVAAYETERSSYLLLEGDEYENEVTVLRGAEEGPTVYVVGGVHGDETAGWSAGDLLKRADIRAGTIYIIAPANPWGAAREPKDRYVTERQDLNRSFPGDPDGTAAERVAAAIFADICDKRPAFVFDLHEARLQDGERDFLGSSLIYSDLSPFGGLFLDLLTATETGEICSEPFHFYAPGPAGSLNRTVTEQCGLPVLTVETFRGYPLERRIEDQLEIVQYVLRSYGMV